MVNTGTYVFQWTTTNAPCAASSDQVQIIKNPLPTPSNAGSDQNICLSTGIATMTANTAVIGIGSWTQISGPLTASITASSTPTTTITGMTTAGTYVFQWDITNSPCPASTDQVQIIMHAPPIVSINGITAICNGSGTTLIASGGSGYLWNTGAISAGITVNPSADTTYAVIGTDANTCSDTAFQLVTVYALPNVAITGSSSLCIGSDTTLLASGAASYVWDFGPVTPSVIVNPAINTTYTVTGTDGNNCTNTAVHTITINPLPNIYAGTDTVICPGTSIDITATGGTGYTWDNGLGAVNPATVSPLTNTTYIVEGTDLNNCINTDTVTVNISILPSVGFNITSDSVCITSGPVSLSGSPLGGAFSGTGVSGSNFNPSTAGIGTFNIIYTVTNTDNCPASAGDQIMVIGCTGIEDNKDVYVNIYPNPSDAFVNIVSSEVIEKIELYDMYGKVIFLNANNAQNFILSMQELASGVYHFRIFTSKGVVVKRVIRK
jgi:hypothetical protein